MPGRSTSPTRLTTCPRPSRSQTRGSPGITGVNEISSVVRTAANDPPDAATIARDPSPCIQRTGRPFSNTSAAPSPSTARMAESVASANRGAVSSRAPGNAPCRMRLGAPRRSNSMMRAFAASGHTAPPSGKAPAALPPMNSSRTSPDSDSPMRSRSRGPALAIVTRPPAVSTRGAT